MNSCILILQSLCLRTNSQITRTPQLPLIHGKVLLRSLDSQLPRARVAGAAGAGESVKAEMSSRRKWTNSKSLRLPST